MNTPAARLAANPFPGLRPFDTAEADRFFGREQQIDELVARLAEVSFLAVTGDSGCGKSSLVRAGLLSRLHAQCDEQNRPRWRSAVLRPGARPLAALAHALVAALEDPQADPSAEDRLLGRLRLGGLGLVDAVRRARFDVAQRLLLVVDQFEEVFRFDLDADEASAFVKLLLNVAMDPASPVAVVITLRSDALGACATHRGLPEAISRGQYLVPRLTRAQRKQAIVGPVETLRGRRMAPRLVQRLLNDVSDTYDELPVLQHVLARTWARWAVKSDGESAIDLEDYEDEQAVGTARHALSLHARQACADLPGLDAVIEKVFRALTERIVDQAEVTVERRRPLPFDRLCQAVGGAPDVVARVVERFRRRDTSFLMDGAPLAGNPTIDISHESLIRLWDRLREWLQAEVEAAQRIRRLIDLAAERREREGPTLQGRSLDEALAWRQQQRPTGAWVGLYVGADQGTVAWAQVEQYLEDSRTAQRRARQRRRLQWMAAMVAGIAGSSVLFGALGHQLAKQAKSRELSNRALIENERMPARAARLALASLDLDGSNRIAAFALRDALAALETGHVVSVLPLPGAVTDIRHSPDRRRLVAVSGDTVRILDRANLEEIGAPIKRAKPIRQAWLLSDNASLLTQTEDGQVQWQALGAEAITPLACPGADNSVFVVGIAMAEHRIALGCYNGEVLLWQAGGRVLEPMHRLTHQANVSITALAFAADGRTLASGDAGGTVNTWRLEQRGEAPIGVWVGQSRPDANDSPLKHDAAVISLEFHPTASHLLISASDDTSATVWDLDSASQRRPGAQGDKASRYRWNLKHVRPVRVARFLPTPDDGRPVVTLAGKTALLWANEEPKRQVRDHEDFITDHDSADDAPLFVTASDDGTARLWSTIAGAPVAVLRAHQDVVKRAMFLSADGGRLLTLGGDGQAFVWQQAAPHVLHASERWVLGAHQSPDARRIAVATEGGGRVIAARGAVGDGKPDTVKLGSVHDNDNVSGLTWSRDGSTVAGMVWRSTTYFEVNAGAWDTTTGARLIPAWLRAQQTARFSPSRDELLTIDGSGGLRLWHAAALREDRPSPLASFSQGDKQNLLAAISPDGRWIATKRDAVVELWNRDRPERLPVLLAGHSGSIRSLSFSRDSRWLLSASTDRTARAWSLDAPGEYVVLEGTTAPLYSAAFDAAGTRIATGSSDGRVDLWSFDASKRSVERLASLHWHSEAVNTIEFSPDGRDLLTGSDDGTVRRGRCEACSADLADLRERVSRFAVLPAAERARIDDETRMTMRDLGWKAWWRKEW